MTETADLLMTIFGVCLLVFIGAPLMFAGWKWAHRRR